MVWLGLRAPEDPGGLAEMPEAAKVAFVETSLAFVAASIFLLVTSVSITILLFVSVLPPLVGRWGEELAGRYFWLEGFRFAEVACPHVIDDRKNKLAVELLCLLDLFWYNLLSLKVASAAMWTLALASAEHVLWLPSQIDLFFGKSKLHTGTDLSTMEAEVIVLAHSFREFFPVVDMAKDLSWAVRLTIWGTIMNVSIR